MDDRLSRWFRNHADTSRHSLKNLFDSWSKIVLSVASAKIGKHLVRPDSKFWWSKELTALKIKRNRARRKAARYLKDNAHCLDDILYAELRNRYAEARTEYRNAVFCARAKAMQHCCSELAGNCKQLWGAFRQVSWKSSSIPPLVE